MTSGKLKSNLHQQTWVNTFESTQRKEKKIELKKKKKTMNPVYEDLNMKIKLWEEEIIPCYLTEKEEKKKNLMPSSRIVFEISELTHYKKIVNFVWLGLSFYSAG